MDEQAKQIAFRWWQLMALSPSELQEKGMRPAPTSYRANLRRCESLESTLFTEAFRALWLQIDEQSTENRYTEKEMQRWAVIASALVHVKKNVRESFAFQGGRKGDGDKSVVSELRFSQLCNAKTVDEFLRRMRRILTQIKGEVNVRALIQDIYFWIQEHEQLRPRQVDKRVSVRWAMDYYQAAGQKKN